MNLLDNINYDIELMSYLREDEKNTEIKFLDSQIEQRELILIDLENIIIINEFPSKNILEIIFKKLETSSNVADFPENDKEKLNDLLFLHKHSKNIELDSLKIHRNRNFKIVEDTNTITEIDLSNSNAVQKIIYLNELGIIDLLLKEPCFATSVNNLANVITAITGEKKTTIQPYLNVLINTTGNENNNPYKTKSTVNKVKNQLLNLGVKPK